MIMASTFLIQLCSHWFVPIISPTSKTYSSWFSFELLLRSLSFYAAYIRSYWFRLISSGCPCSQDIYGDIFAISSSKHKGPHVFITLLESLSGILILYFVCILFISSILIHWLVIYRYFNHHIYHSKLILTVGIMVYSSFFTVFEAWILLITKVQRSLFLPILLVYAFLLLW